MAASNSSGVSDTVIESLIEAIRRHPCVYDTEHIDYRDQLRKDNAWEQTRVHCGLATVDDCQKL